MRASHGSLQLQGPHCGSVGKDPFVYFRLSLQHHHAGVINYCRVLFNAMSLYSSQTSSRSPTILITYVDFANSTNSSICGMPIAIDYAWH